MNNSTRSPDVQQEESTPAPLEEDVRIESYNLSQSHRFTILYMQTELDLTAVTVVSPCRRRPVSSYSRKGIEICTEMMEQKGPADSEPVS